MQPLDCGVYGGEKIRSISFSIQKLLISTFLNSSPLSDCSFLHFPKDKIYFLRIINTSFADFSLSAYENNHFEKWSILFFLIKGLYVS